MTAPATPRRLSVSDRLVYGDALLAALERMTVAGEEVYGAENLQGEVYHDLLEPEIADQLRDAIEQARALLRDLSPEEEGQ